MPCLQEEFLFVVFYPYLKKKVYVLRIFTIPWLITVTILESLPAAFVAMHRYFLTACVWLLSSKEYDSTLNFIRFSSQSLMWSHENHVYFTCGGWTSPAFLNVQFNASPFRNTRVSSWDSISGFTVQKKYFIWINLYINHAYVVVLIITPPAWV